MAYLGDVIGQLLSEIAAARVQADLEAVRVAEHYARDPLLKNLPVPRFRLPTVTMRVPVAISDVPMQSEKDPPRGSVDPARIEATALNAFYDYVAQLRISGDDVASVEKLVSVYVQRIVANPLLIPTATTLADEIVEQIMSVLKDAATREGTQEGLFEAGEALRKRLTDDFVDARSDPPRLSVLVTAAELRDAANIVTLDFTLTEEAVEWALVDTSSGQARRLVIE